MNTQKRPFRDLCLESPNKEIIYVSIPKNASSFTSDWLTENGWISREISSTDPKYVMLILRDPVDRWCSGIAQYLSYLEIHPEEYTSATDRLIFDVVNRFDDHTWPQHVFYEDVFPNKPKIAFHTDMNLQHSLRQYHRLNSPVTENYNRSVETTNNLKVEYFKNKLNDPQLLDKVKKAYQKDYDLMSTMSFVHYPPNQR